jgi:hypothetical protein
MRQGEREAPRLSVANASRRSPPRYFKQGKPMPYPRQHTPRVVVAQVRHAEPWNPADELTS